jgi:hypothetical protein
MEATQGSRTIKEWYCEIHNLAKGVTDISDRMLVLRFWAGARPYFCIEWAKVRFTQEDVSIDNLLEYAEGAEVAEGVMKCELGQNTSYYHGGNTGQSSTPQNNYRNRYTNVTASTSKALYKPQGNPPSQGKPADCSKGCDGKLYKGKSTMSRDKMNELRAANKCFTCKEVGHTSKDCPKQNQACLQNKPVKLASINLKAIDERGCVAHNLSLHTIGPPIDWSKPQDIPPKPEPVYLQDIVDSTLIVFTEMTLTKGFGPMLALEKCIKPSE